MKHDRETGMNASMVMDPNPSVLLKDEKISSGVKLIMEHRYRNIPVVDDKGCYLGMFGVNCLLRLVLPRAVVVDRGLTTVPFVSDTLRDLRYRLKTVEGKAVTYCMTEKEVTPVAPDTPLVETLLVLYKTRSSVPVVDPDSGCLVGMISYWDVGEKILEQDI
jgi:CBS-domain-containing membrane protein